MGYNRVMFDIVEDTNFARILLEEMLLKLNVPSKSFSNAQAYIDYVNSSAFQLPIATFTDVMMPDYNGYEMIKILQVSHAHMEFIITTNEPCIRPEYSHLGFLYLAKPYRLDRLASVVIDQLSQRR